MRILYPAFALLCVCLFTACQDETSILPKPHAFPRVIYPVGDIEPFQLEVCPFSFGLPSYDVIERDTTYFDEATKHPCWFDLVTPSLNGRVHFSYYPIANLADFEKLRDDAFVLAGKHNSVAEYIEEIPIDRPEDRVHGYAFELDGNVASPYQFYLSDSTNHFLRGALYVNAQANADSLAPIYDFLQRDLEEVIESLQWENDR